MRRLRWTSEASDRLIAAIEYIRQDDLEAAWRVALEIVEGIETVARFPNSGRVGEVPEPAN